MLDLCQIEYVEQMHSILNLKADLGVFDNSEEEKGNYESKSSWI